MKLALASLLFVASLAFLSGCTVKTNWSGAWPAGAFDVRVTNEEQVPIPGAKVSLHYEDGTSADGFPIPEFAELGYLITDEAGSLQCHKPGRGIEFGGEIDTFLGIKISESGGEPIINCRITHEAYEPQEFKWTYFFIDDMTDTSEYRKYRVYTVKERYGKDEEQQLPLYYPVFVLKRKSQSATD